MAGPARHAQAPPTLVPLGHYDDRIWHADPGAYGGRKRRAGGPYRVFIPAEIADWHFVLDDDAVAATADATRALAHLGASSPRVASVNALASNLLRSESAASSRIEGLQISHRRLARAAYKGSGKSGGDTRAAEVLGNVEAMSQAVAPGAKQATFSVADIEVIHRTLLRFTADRKIAGVIRDEQSWIGGNDYNPTGATYVPPPPDEVPRLLDDFCKFASRDDLAPIAQAAIAHAQFENIHPFIDGNGRVGRALIYSILRRRNEIAKYIPPISLVLAAEQRNYIAGLGAFSQGDVSLWITTFADATRRAAHAAERLAEEIEERQREWLERLAQPRKDSAVRQLVSSLPEHPVIDVAAARALTGKSHVAVQNALAQLEAARIVTRLNEKKWGRVWECKELLDLVEEFEEDVVVP